MKFMINSGQLIIMIGAGEWCFPNTPTGYKAMTAMWQQWRNESYTVKRNIS